MQRESPSVAPPSSVSVDRTQQVYKAHTALEEYLASVDALSNAVKEQPRSVGGFDPRTMLVQSLSDVRRQALVCLRLFSPARTLRSARGMDSVSTLYGSSSEPTVRLSQFLRYLRTRLDEALPCAISVSAVRVAKRSSAKVAAKMASDELTSVLTAAGAADSETSSAITMAARALDTHDDVVKAVMDLGLLKAECAAAVNDHTSPLSEQVPTLSTCLPAESVAALIAHEEACWRQVPVLRQAADEQAAKRAALATTAPPTSATPTTSPTETSNAGSATAALAAGSPSTTVQPASTNTHRNVAADGGSTGALSRLWNNQMGWKGRAIKAVGAILFILLVRFFGTRLYEAVKSATTLAHGAPTRRRTLTL